MTKTERKAVAKTLREWAAWCEAKPYFKWHEWPVCYGGPAWHIAYSWCHNPHVNGLLFDVAHRGPTAATGLLLAAAMIEAGDEA
jgi:hypothetical protein